MDLFMVQLITRPKVFNITTTDTVANVVENWRRSNNLSQETFMV